MNTYMKRNERAKQQSNFGHMMSILRLRSI